MDRSDQPHPTLTAEGSLIVDYEISAEEFGEVVFAATSALQATASGKKSQWVTWIWIGIACLMWALVGVLHVFRTGRAPTFTFTDAINATTSGEWLLGWLAVWLPAVIYNNAVRRGRGTARVVSLSLAVTLGALVAWVWFSANHATHRQPLAGWGSWRIVPWVTVGLLAYRYVNASWTTRAHRAAFARTHFAEGPRRLVISHDGVEDVGPLQRSFAAWPFLVEVKETPRFLLFVTRAGLTMFILPKRCVDAGSLERLLSAVRSRVGRGTGGAFDVITGEAIPLAEIASPQGTRPR